MTVEKLVNSIWEMAPQADLKGADIIGIYIEIYILMVLGIEAENADSSRSYL